jgi:hypothetical protein
VTSWSQRASPCPSTSLPRYARLRLMCAPLAVLGCGRFVLVRAARSLHTQSPHTCSGGYTLHTLHTVSTHALWRLCTHTLSTLARSLHTQSPHTLWRLYSLYTHSLSPHAPNRGFTLCMRLAQALFGVSQTKFGDGRTFPLARSSPRPQGKDLSESKERPSPQSLDWVVDRGTFPLARSSHRPERLHALARHQRPALIRALCSQTGVGH